MAGVVIGWMLLPENADAKPAARIRFAAVFAILTLMPPELEAEPELESRESKAESEPSSAPARQSGEDRGRTTEPARHSATTTPGSSDSNTTQTGYSVLPPEEGHEGSAPAASDHGSRQRPRLRLELVGLGETALGAFEEPRGQIVGGELRVLLARTDFAPLLTVGFAPPARLQTGRVDVDLQRLQMGLGVRAQSALGPRDVGADFSLLGALERAGSVGLEHPARENGFELGARAAALVSLASGRVGPLLAVHASAFPVVNQFEALPRGDVGHTPHVWLGAALGVFLGL